LLVILLSYPVKADSIGLKTIIIDAGHGGSDKGGEGSDGMLEKDAALQISQSLKNKIVKMKLNVVMTRDKDNDVPLEKRIAIANDSNGGVFISIHTGSAHSDELSGIGIYYLDYERVRDEFSEAAQDDAEDDRKDVEMILKDMTRSNYVNEGAILSELLQKNLTEIITDQKVTLKPAPISILKDVNMPSVLIEFGNITNNEDVRRLKDRGYINKVTDAILNGIIEYDVVSEKEISK
jgi:N-acetylmuramoyl-L-alanine amidase